MSSVLTSQIENVFVVTINRPKVRNAIDGPTAQDLYDAFHHFDLNEDLYVAVLTGAEDIFCAGADLKSLAVSSGKAPNLTIDGNAPLGVSRMKLNKPVIAAVEGHAVAGGLELALWCDMRVAAEDAVFGVFCRRFGVPLVDGGTIRLPRLVGHGRAMDMILTGRGVKSDEALRIGLVNRVVTKGKAFTNALELARSLCQFPQKCMRSDRLSAYEQWNLELNQALSNESKRGLEVIKSGETKEGAIRFTKGQL